MKNLQWTNVSDDKYVGKVGVDWTKNVLPEVTLMK